MSITPAISVFYLFFFSHIKLKRNLNFELCGPPLDNAKLHKRMKQIIFIYYTISIHSCYSRNSCPFFDGFYFSLFLLLPIFIHMQTVCCYCLLFLFLLFFFFCWVAHVPIWQSRTALSGPGLRLLTMLTIKQNAQNQTCVNQYDGANWKFKINWILFVLYSF